MPGIGRPALGAGAPGAGTAVMPVRHVGHRDRLERRHRRRRVRHRPDTVPHPVGGGEVVEGRAPGVVGDQPVERGGVPHREEHRLGVGVEGQDVPGAVVFLVPSGLFVLADDVGGVVVHVHAAHHPGLGPAVHDQLVQVAGGPGLADEDPIPNEPVEVVAGRLVHAVVVGIDVGREVDVGPADVQEAQGVPRRQPGRFLAVDHVVRGRRDLGGDLGARPPGGERLEADDSSRAVGSASRRTRRHPTARRSAPSSLRGRCRGPCRTWRSCRWP